VPRADIAATPRRIDKIEASVNEHYKKYSVLSLRKLIVASLGLCKTARQRRDTPFHGGQATAGENFDDQCWKGLCQSRRKLMSKYALYVPLEAKPGKEKEVADFLRAAVPLVNAEPGTISWFAIQEGPSRFAIFDTFDDDAGRNAHLNGKVAAALMEKARTGDLFVKAPEIHRIDVLADKLPR
jgi:quinol monooxygenase YgiN